MIARDWLRVGLALGLVAVACEASVDAPASEIDTEVPGGMEAGVDAHVAAPKPIVEAAVPAMTDASTRIADAGSPEGDASFFGASRCANGSFLMCEDFEGDALDAKRWFYNPGNGGNASGHAEIDKTRAARGNHSLHFRTETNTKGSGSQVKARDPDPRLGDGFYLRAFMYFAQPIPDHHLNYFNIVAPGVDGGMFNLGSLDGKLGIVEFGPRNGDHAVTADPLIVGRWFCVEWQVHPQASEVRVWVDETDVPALHVTDWTPSPFTDFFLELISYQGAYDVWIDELAYDTQRIGCRR